MQARNLKEHNLKESFELEIIKITVGTNWKYGKSESEFVLSAALCIARPYLQLVTVTGKLL